MSVPTSIVDSSLRFLWLLWGGFAVAGGLGLWFAWWLARGLSRPIRAIAKAAPALGQGQPLVLPDAGSVDELRQLVRALEEAAATIREREDRQQAAEQALRAADRAKDEFLAMLGHELRNPLASVANASHLLKLAPRRPEVIADRRRDPRPPGRADDAPGGRPARGRARHRRQDPAGEASRSTWPAVVAAVIETWRSGDRLLHHTVRSDLHEVWVACRPHPDRAGRRQPARQRPEVHAGRRSDRHLGAARGRRRDRRGARHRRRHAARADRPRVRPVRPGRAQPRPRARRARHRPDPGAPPGRDERRHDPGDERGPRPGSDLHGQPAGDRASRGGRRAAPPHRCRSRRKPPAAPDPDRRGQRRRAREPGLAAAPGAARGADRGERRAGAGAGARRRAPTSSCSTSACPTSTATRSRAGSRPTRRPATSGCWR